ncbi:hypothetical protein IG197_27485 [Aminobacter sp. SR38]|jgi:hypothetical protein|uniref:hypothetical protein n=1 Tax=Aminobacter sp. SR38 TaxID=2774562 RepID=UPI00177E095B|nr:hypothetical protein [Aminobacter sp. SR38]QOF71443.1 hypothetical protein IG197_27485 [Aminobacter sp. SR38]
MTDLEKLEEANAAISMAAMVLISVAPTLEQFLGESNAEDSVGTFAKLSLFMRPQQRDTEALMQPLYVAALTFAQTYKAQLRAAINPVEASAHG